MAKWNFYRVTTELPAPPGEAPSSEGTPPPVAHRPWSSQSLYYAAGAAAVVLLVLAIWAVRARRSDASELAGSDVTGEALRTASVERRDFIRTLRLHGVVAAVESQSVSAPRLAGQGGGGNMIITRLAKPGPVERGDVLVEFDNQNQLRAALDRDVEFRDLEEQIKKKRAEHAAARSRDDTELKEAENAVVTAELEMRRNEVISRIDAEKNQQNLQEATARLAQLRETFELKQRAREAELRILEIQRGRSRNAMLHAQGNSRKMTIRSPAQGVAVLQSVWKENGLSEVQEGDQIWPGTAVLDVVNPRGMEVRARVNQADFPYLRVGQPVRVRLDAYPELVFPGKVARVAAVGTTSSMSQKVRQFAAVFSIEGSDPKLLPDLSAAVDIELERQPQALVVPRDAIVTEGEQAYVRVQSGSGWSKRAVKVGAQCDHEAVIESGLEAGTVVLRRPGGS